MSFQAMTWATETTCGSATTKLVLLMLANHANGHTGQCNPRHKTLAAECEIRVETLKDHLKRLADAGLIEILPQFMDGVQLPNQYRLNMHRGGGEFRPVGGGEERTGGGCEFRPPNNQERNQEVNQHPQPPEGASSGKPAEESPAEHLNTSFAKFWETYPKKVGKDAAASAWKRKVRSLVTCSEIMKSLDAQKRSEDWKKDNGQFIPNPATWLNQGRWKDEGTSAADDASSRYI